MNFADEMFDHFLSGVEIGNHALAHGPDRLDRAGRAAEHQLGVFTDRQNGFSAVSHMISNHRGLVEDDPLALDIDQRVGRAEVDCHVAGKKS